VGVSTSKRRRFFRLRGRMYDKIDGVAAATAATIDAIAAFAAAFGWARRAKLSPCAGLGRQRTRWRRLTRSKKMSRVFQGGADMAGSRNIDHRIGCITRNEAYDVKPCRYPCCDYCSDCAESTCSSASSRDTLSQCGRKSRVNIGGGWTEGAGHKQTIVGRFCPSAQLLLSGSSFLGPRPA
jgi:hypothetical protein